jgi:hypothetical protein
LHHFQACLVRLFHSSCWNPSNFHASITFKSPWILDFYGEIGEMNHFWTNFSTSFRPWHVISWGVCCRGLPRPWRWWKAGEEPRSRRAGWTRPQRFNNHWTMVGICQQLWKLQIYIYIYLYNSIYLYVHTHISKYIYIHIIIYIYIYVYI